jgi:DNA helicase II / ATP-dependent DNA helicase PcrA
LIPHERSLRSGELREIEEERRLLFVGMTRAKQELFLTETRQREFRGRPLYTIRSDFLNEMDIDEQDETSGMSPSSWGGGKHLDDDFADTESDDFDEKPNPVKRGSVIGQKSLLMTGADLLNGMNETEESESGSFETGMLVRHPRYGVGTIVETGGYSRHRTVTVLFKFDERKETFIVAKSPLQPIGS